eukprot:TRINITY_DN37752_c0_g2_i1.p1 TRINITY_DN37752_c0_g2~~TRINITY_DN37752_c0_g2_i1.p1  ORF type:complete len:457 (+),score=157.49 TRINITY_DN37752_c0_g2_i1:74-1444(+)
MPPLTRRAKHAAEHGLDSAVAPVRETAIARPSKRVAGHSLAAAALEVPAGAAGRAHAKRRPAPAAADVPKGKRTRKAAAVVEVPPEEMGADELCAMVSSGISEVYPSKYPDAVKAMMQAMVRGCLEEPKESRVAPQVRCVEMIGTLLADSEAALEAQLEKFQADHAKAEAEKSACEEKKKELDEVLASAREVTASKKAALAEASKALKKLGHDAIAADEQRAGLEKEYRDTALRRDFLQNAIEERYKNLKRGVHKTAEEVTEAIHDLLGRLQEPFHFEASMLQVLPALLSKDPATRGPFDDKVLEQFEDAAAEQREAIQKRLDGQEARKAERILLAEAAQEAMANAEEVRQAAVEELSDAQEASKEAQEAVKDAGRSLREVCGELKELLRGAEATRVSLAAFRAGPKAAFVLLKDGPSSEPAAPDLPSSASAAAAPDQAVTNDAAQDADEAAVEAQ